MEGRKNLTESESSNGSLILAIMIALNKQAPRYGLGDSGLRSLKAEPNSVGYGQRRCCRGEG